MWQQQRPSCREGERGWHAPPMVPEAHSGMDGYVAVQFVTQTDMMAASPQPWLSGRYLAVIKFLGKKYNRNSQKSMDI